MRQVKVITISDNDAVYATKKLEEKVNNFLQEIEANHIADIRCNTALQEKQTKLSDVEPRFFITMTISYDM